MNRLFTLLFLTHVFTRLAFSVIVGFYNNYNLQLDSEWLVGLSDKMLVGDYNFELERFIVSPLYPLICGTFKLVFASYWSTALVIFQILLAALSGVYLYKIAILLFKNEKIAILSSLIFAVFPLTIYYVNTFSQECLFQSLLIFTIYSLLKTLEYPSIKNAITAAILYALAYQTKSHLLLFSLFIPLIFFHKFRFSKNTLIYSFVFAAIALLFSLPYGLYQLKQNNTYVISSNGAGYQLYLGNSEIGYRSIVDVPTKGTQDYLKMQELRTDVAGTIGYFNFKGSRTEMDSILALPQKERQKAFTTLAIAWIKENPMKFLKLKVYNTFFYIMPGVSFRHYTLPNYLFSLLMSLPIYLFAYIAIISESRKKFSLHSFMFYLFVTMFLFSSVWYVQNRFRTITVEPFYIVYASVLFYWLIEKSKILNRVFSKIASFYITT